MNFFDTLNDALRNAEGHHQVWECSGNHRLLITRHALTWQDGSKYGHYVTMMRDIRDVIESASARQA
jgi:hypothetical protein